MLQLLTKSKILAIGCLSALSLATLCLASDDSTKKETLWTTGSALMPGWGLYPNVTKYGGSELLGNHAAWGTGRLTWIANIPADGVFQVWVRQYGGYGSVQVSVNEQVVDGGAGSDGSARYVWKHLGEAPMGQGEQHLDIAVGGTMLDAVLLTTSKEFQPEKDQLPEPIRQPILRARRTYREDSTLNAAAGNTGFVVGAIDLYDEHLNDFVPASDELLQTVKLWGAANQYLRATFAIRTLREIKELTVTLKELTGADQTSITVEQIDIRIVHLRERIRFLYEWANSRLGLCPDLLLRDDRTALPPSGQQGGFGGGSCVTSMPAHESRQVWLTVHVPENLPPGSYRGTIHLQVVSDAERCQQLPVEIEVMPLELKPVEGWYGIYHPSQPVHTDQPRYVSPERYLSELNDQVRHGLNGATLYGGWQSIKYAQQAGMTQPPVLPHWPGEDVRSEIDEAHERGFTDVYHYGVDEPHGDTIEQCRQEAERRLKAGLHMFTAVNSKAAWDATKDFIDRPVYNIYVFDADSGAAQYARQRGFVPISYWSTSVSFPLYYRALAGLYNTASGYAGVAPWAYADTPNTDIYKVDDPMHAVSYPDEFGEPIPSLRWEAFRDGIDDVRYLQALTRAIATADDQIQQPEASAELSAALAQARQVLKEHIDPIGGRWFRYLNGLQPTTLDTTRRSMAEATVAITSQLNR